MIKLIILSFLLFTSVHSFSKEERLVEDTAEIFIESATSHLPFKELREEKRNSKVPLRVNNLEDVARDIEVEKEPIPEEILEVAPRKPVEPVQELAEDGNRYEESEPVSEEESKEEILVSDERPRDEVKPLNEGLVQEDKINIKESSVSLSNKIESKTNTNIEDEKQKGQSYVSDAASLRIKIGANSTKWSKFDSSLEDGSRLYGLGYTKSLTQSLALSFDFDVAIRSGIDTLSENIAMTTFTLGGNYTRVISNSIVLNAGLGLNFSDYNVRAETFSEDSLLQYKRYAQGSAFGLTPSIEGKIISNSNLSFGLRLEYRKYFGDVESNLSNFSILPGIYLDI